MPDNIQRIPNKFQGLFALIAQFYSLTQCENKQNKTTKNNDIVNNFEQRKKYVVDAKAQPRVCVVCDRYPHYNC